MITSELVFSSCVIRIPESKAATAEELLLDSDAEAFPSLELFLELFRELFLELFRELLRELFLELPLVLLERLLNTCAMSSAFACSR